MILNMSVEQTINGETYRYFAESTTDIELYADQQARHFAAIGAELQAMADDDRRKIVRQIDWSRLSPSLN